MTAGQQKKLLGRLRRIAGQVRALELAMGKPDTEVTANQFLAVIAATKAGLRFYLEARILGQEEISQSDRALIARLLNRVD